LWLEMEVEVRCLKTRLPQAGRLWMLLLGLRQQLRDMSTQMVIVSAKEEEDRVLAHLLIARCAVRRRSRAQHSHSFLTPNP